MMEIKDIEFEQDSHGLWDIYVTFEGTDKEMHIIGDECDASDLEISEDSPYLEDDYERFVLDQVRSEFEQWLEDEKIQRQHDLYDLYNDR